MRPQVSQIQEVTVWKERRHVGWQDHEKQKQRDTQRESVCLKLEPDFCYAQPASSFLPAKLPTDLRIGTAGI